MGSGYKSYFISHMYKITKEYILTKESKNFTVIQMNILKQINTEKVRTILKIFPSYILLMQFYKRKYLAYLFCG